MQRYLIGNSKTKEADISINQESISRRHAELIHGKDNTYLLIDRNSTNGTFVLDADRWMRIRQKIVSLNTKIILGKYKTDIKSLLNLDKESKKENYPIS